MALYFCAMKIWYTGVIAFLLLLSCESNTAQQTVKLETLGVTEFKQAMAGLKNFQLIDVRTPGEYMEEHLNNALNIDYNDATFASQLDQLDKTKPTFIYCLSGGRSSQALQVMHNKGFVEVYNMKGGIMEWKGHQFPLTKTVFNGWRGMSVDDYKTLTTSTVPVLIDFRAKWCGPCKQLKPILDEIRTEQNGKIQIVEIDIDENKSLAEHMHITNIPLLMYYKNGELIQTVEGFMEKQDLLKTFGML
jgi:thioredoxin 1